VQQSSNCSLFGVFCQDECQSSAKAASFVSIISVSSCFIFVPHARWTIIILMISFIDFVADLIYLIITPFSSFIMILLCLAFVFTNILLMIVQYSMQYRKTFAFKQCFYMFIGKMLSFQATLKDFKANSLEKFIFFCIISFIYAFSLFWVGILSLIGSGLYVAKVPIILVSLILFPTKLIVIPKVAELAQKILIKVGFEFRSQKIQDSTLVSQFLVLSSLTESSPMFAFQLYNRLVLKKEFGTFEWIKLILSGLMFFIGIHLVVKRFKIGNWKLLENPKTRVLPSNDKKDVTTEAPSTVALAEIK
jgi:hypothetical protein